MATTKTIDSQIINYLKVLSDKEKKAVLTVAETFAKEYELSEEEKVELDELKKQHKAGKSKSYTVAEVRKNAYKALKK